MSQQQEEDINDKNKRNGHVGFLRFMIIATTCLLGFGAIISFGPTETAMNNIETSSIRHNEKKKLVKMDENVKERIVKDDVKEEKKEEKFSEAVDTLNDAKKRHRRGRGRSSF